VLTAWGRSCSVRRGAMVSPETLGSLAIGAIALGAMPTPREVAGAALVLEGATLAIHGRLTL
jgi:hypothetical protein